MTLLLQLPVARLQCLSQTRGHHGAHRASITCTCVNACALCSGRVQAMLVARGIGVVCQSMMALEPKLWPVTWIMVPILLLRIGARGDVQTGQPHGELASRPTVHKP